MVVHSQHIQAVEDNHLVENIHNPVEQGSLVVVDIHQALDQAVLDILLVVVESLAVETLAGQDIQDILDSLHTVDIPNTSRAQTVNNNSQIWVSVCPQDHNQHPYITHTKFLYSKTSLIH